MRVMTEMTADADGTYEPNYFHQLRGVVWNKLPDDIVSDHHQDAHKPSFCFSNPFPPHDHSEGETRRVIFSTPYSELAHALASELNSGDEFNIGENSFTVESAFPFSDDVGEPGESGTLETYSGTYVELNEPWQRELGVADEYSADRISWDSSMPFDGFLKRVRENLRQKHEMVHDSYLESPTTETSLFTGFEMITEYPIHVQVTSTNEYERTFVLSKWKLDYTVRNDDHRRWLNLLFDSGIGYRNTLGFGFLNKQ